MGGGSLGGTPFVNTGWWGLLPLSPTDYFSCNFSPSRLSRVVIFPCFFYLFLVMNFGGEVHSVAAARPKSFAQRCDYFPLRALTSISTDHSTASTGLWEQVGIVHSKFKVLSH